MLLTMAPLRAAAIVLAAGAGRRLGIDEPKALLPIAGRPILSVASASAASSGVESLVVTAPAGFEDRVRSAVGPDATVVTGGDTRQESVRTALAAVSAQIDVVAVHDAARPFAPPALFDDVIAAVVEGADGAIPVVPIADTVKRIEDHLVVGTEPREGLALAQTPQAFRVDVLRDAHDRAAEAGLGFTDDAAILEWAGYRVRAVPGDPENFKITTLMDLARADARMGGGDE
jgi:2-C-methyl-D-erythritol 4-phosphate cytidylyltransferase